MQWIFSNVELNLNLVSKSLSQSVEQRTTTRKEDTFLYDICIELRWRLLKCLKYSILDFGYRFLKEMRNLLIAYGHSHRKRRYLIRTDNNEIFRRIIQLW